jgi:hypothetical protein
MAVIEISTPNLSGMYRDIVYDARGRVVEDRGWKNNAIVADCRRLLAAFMSGSIGVGAGITGIQVGMGLPAWDLTSPPSATSAQASLVDPNPHTVVGADLSFAFLNGAAVSPTPTNRLQIVAQLGPGVPSWPDANHASGNLREFGLVGQLGGSPILINYVTHPVIAKDPSSTLERTIWLAF